MKNKVLIFLVTIILISSFLVLSEVKAGAGDNVWGWAWSENIGWISFNCYNDTDGDGVRDTDCTDSGYADYGVNIDETTGKFSGYAWAGDVGAWLSFNRADTGAPPPDDPCPDGSCVAKIDLELETYEVSGWTKVLGWDNWIKLRGTVVSTGSPYGVSLNIGSIPSEFEGWAYGEGPIGWISFNYKNCDTDDNGFIDVACGGDNITTAVVDYKVMTDVSTTPAPTLSVTLEAATDSTTWLSPLPEERAPLNNVDLKADVGGTATGTVTFRFDCEDNEAYEAEFSHVDVSSPDGAWIERLDDGGTTWWWTKIISADPVKFAVQDLCDYSSAADYIARVSIDRDIIFSEEDTVDIKVTDNTAPVVVIGSSAQGESCPESPDYTPKLDPPVILNWSFSDDDGDSQDSYQVEIWESGGGPLVEDSCSPSPGTCASGNDGTAYAPPTLNFDTNYDYNVTVWDNYESDRKWDTDSATLFIDPSYPEPNFTWDPVNPGAGEETSFTSTTTCYTASCACEYIFEDGIPGLLDLDCTLIATTEFGSDGVKTVTLTATDLSGNSCSRPKSVSVGGALPLPEWREIPPF